MATTRAWPMPDEESVVGWGLVVLLALAAIVFVHRETFDSMVAVWRQSETFAHCFLIAPLSAYLLWQRRHELAAAPKRISSLGLVAVAVLTVAWFVARSVDVQFGEHLAVTLLIPAAVLALLGVHATKTIALPLGYLLFMVPFGEFLIPGLMDLTASFTVAALRLTGIPVLREGMFFSIPSGDFEVAKACSGIRYLIACLALGVLFASIAYRGWRKRLIFIAASIAAPLLGNCVRAYLIVLIAHWSELRLAVGVDHLIYGWLFFGMLVFVMFWIGSRFQDEPVADQAAAGAPPGPTSPLPVRIGVGIAAVALVALGPWALARSPDPRAISLPPLVLPHAVADWQGPVARGETWQLDGFDRRAGGVYVSAAGSVALELLGCCAAPADVIGAFPALVDSSQWQTLQTRGSEVAAGARSLRISETILRSRSEERVVWRWYVVGGELIASDWRAKTVQTWLALRGRPEDSMLVVLSSAAPEAVSARQVLETFMRDNGERIVACFEMHHCVAAR